MHIAPITPADLDDWAAMRAALWPDYPPEELCEDAAAMLAIASPQSRNLIARIEGAPAGFAEAAIRTDYVNGCETSPVAFLEGIWVAPAHRHHGIARALAEAVADWARTLGCTEFASDALLDNRDSHAFHAAIGFQETERVVYFRRRLDTEAG
jgi:aminoglycoside 6'-N-acetyltransferase I